MPDELQSLWPTYVLRKEFADHEKLKDALMSFVKKYMAENRNTREANENRGLYESQYDIFRKYCQENDALFQLANFLAQGFGEVSEAANQAVWRLNKIDTSTLGVTIIGSWFIHYRDGGNVDPHIHSNCSWSSAYYLQMGEVTDDRDGGTFFISPANKSDSDDLGNAYSRITTRNFRAVEGHALFFPSSLVHGSYPFSGAQSKIIFSANAKISQK